MPSSLTTQLKFTHALHVVRSIPIDTIQPIAADKLQFYGLYKQATEGDINIPKPSSRQIVEYAKWKAWSRMKGFSPVEAQQLYIESLIQLLTEFIYRYPHHEQATFMKDTLTSLQCDSLPGEEDLFLNGIEPDQFMQEDSPTSTPHSTFSHVLDNNYPITPMTSPGHSTRMYKQYHDVLSEPDTIDREVAATTAHLSLSSPKHSPYSPRKSRKKSDRALEKLQTDVSVLTEQVEHLRTDLQTKKKPWLWRLLRAFIKHVITHSAILCIAFYILYRQKSPLAYTVIQHMKPIIQVMIRHLFQKVVFWKITV